MTMCRHELHALYEPNCPGCNAEGYARLLEQAPQGKPGQPDAEHRPTRQTAPPRGHDQSYGDTY